jgi:hydrogenase expression/formation protein HypE
LTWSDGLPPLDLRRGRVQLGHGSGGRLARQLVEQLFLPALHNPALAALDDGAVLAAPAASAGQRLVLATDGHVVDPLFFPGGDIGSLAVHGTVNDVAMMGATPLALTASFVLEEGFALADLRRIVGSMGQAAQAVGVPVVAGDTKVVQRGKGDGVFIATTGLGTLPTGRELSATRVRAGDVLLLSGPIGRHGAAILSRREALGFDTELESDTAPLHGLVAELLAAVPEGAVHALRDPTRGGLAALLHEFARAAQVGIEIDEAAVPVPEPVRAACEWLGLEPMQLANEGVLVAAVDAAHADTALHALRRHPLGRDAVRIGHAIRDADGFVQMRTALGAIRLVDWPAAEALPRIC